MQRPKKVMKIKLNYLLPIDYDLGLLTEQERQVIEMRWGLGIYLKHYSHREIAAALGGGTSTRICRIEQKAVKKLRANK